MSERLYHVEGPNAVFGLVVDSDGVVINAPSKKYIGQLFTDLQNELFSYSNGQLYYIENGEKVYVGTTHRPLYVDSFFRGLYLREFDEVANELEKYAKTSVSLNKAEILFAISRMMKAYENDIEGYLIGD